MLNVKTETTLILEPNIVLLSVSPLYSIVEEDTEDLFSTENLQTEKN